MIEKKTKIGPVLESDAVHILPLIQENFPYYQIDLPELIRRIHSAQFWCYKSMENGELTGYAEWEVIDEATKIIRLNGIAVFPAFQRKGFGNMLLHAGEKAARARHMKKMILIVAEDNGVALQLYDENGWGFAHPHLQKIGGKKAEVWEKILE